jgi:hypothetical protein
MAGVSKAFVGKWFFLLLKNFSFPPELLIA